MSARRRVKSASKTAKTSVKKERAAVSKNRKQATRRRRGWASVKNSTTSPAAIERAFRIAEACRLRARGLSYERIGRVMGLGTMTVHAMILDAIRASVPPEVVEMERALELDRLDLLQTAIFQKAATGDAQAIAAVLAIMVRRARYLGLD